MKVLVAGASGFVGRRLCPALEDAGHEVRAMTRHPESYAGAGTPVAGDVGDPQSLDAALAGCDAAYYLVHSLDAEDFESKDADGAKAFAEAASEAGLTRIVYLGGLGNANDELSPHLRSRRQVEEILGGSGVPVTTLRAGIIIGDGGISWEMTRQLVDHLPAMVTPRWVMTRTQPIAVADVVRYLVGVLELPEAEGQALEIGGPEVLRYKTMLQRVAKILGRDLPIVPVPLLSPQLSSLWLALVTDVDTTTGRNLVDSMTNEVVVHYPTIRRLIPFEPMSYDDAVRAALDERADRAEREAATPAPRSERGPFEKFLRSMPQPFHLQTPKVPDESDAVRNRRRQVVVGVGIAGATLLGVSLSTKPGSQKFYWLTAALAATWTAGAIASGPLHMGYLKGRDETLRRPVVTPIATGIGAFGVFYGGALVAREIPFLNQAIGNVLRYADQGNLPLVATTTAVNGLAEELFFRGAFYTAAPQSPILISTIAYTAATAASRNPALVVAGGVLGALFGLQRRASG
ncbi:MAG: NAD(P)H-binding protein, partial [Lapillicoccus sp.]